jgi:hypothetical protein
MEISQLQLRAYTKAAAVTPNDSTDLGNIASALYIGTAGDLKVTTVGGSTVTFNEVPVGVFDAVIVSRVWSTGTAAADIIALYGQS